MDDSLKEVYCGQYCHACVHFDKLGFEDPCDECLSEPANTYSHKPVKYEEKEKNNGHST